jgi:hypothetical protein
LQKTAGMKNWGVKAVDLGIKLCTLADKIKDITDT